MSKPSPTFAPPLAGAPGADLLAPRALIYLNIRDAAVTMVSVGLASWGIWCIAQPPLRSLLWVALAIIMCGSLLIELPWLNRVHVRTTTYTVTSDYVYIVRGRIWRRSVLIATPQVLNIETVQGPLLRALGLVSLKFTCIVELERLGPLSPIAAERVRAAVLGAFARDDDE